MTADHQGSRPQSGQAANRGGLIRRGPPDGAAGAGAAGATPPTMVDSPAVWLAAMALIAGAYMALALAAGRLPLAQPHAASLAPAAGLALGALLICGLRCWPGVWLGAFVAALAVEPTLDGGAVAVLVATGATLQALVGALLTRRFLSLGGPISRESHIWGFLLLGGPVACLVAASAGTLTLLVLAQLPPSHAPYRWLVWWAGDTLGVVLFAPLVILAWPGQDGVWGRRRHRVALPLLVTAVLLAVGHWGFQRIEQERLQRLVDEAAEDVHRRALLATAGATEPLRSLARFFAASREVTREEFATFAALALEQPGLLALDWAPRLPAGERRGFEGAQRGDGVPDYQVFELDDDARPRPLRWRPTYFPVRFTEPPGTNRVVLGLDHGFEEARREAMERAVEEGTVAAAAVRLLRTEGRAVLVFNPVYPPGFEDGAADADGRRRALQGFIVGVLDTAALFEEAVRFARHKGLVLGVWDAPEAGDPTLLAGTAATAETAVRRRDLPFAARPWHVELVPRSDLPPATTGWRAPAYFGLAVLAALLVSFAALAAAGRQAATEALVAARTATLGARERDLDITLKSIGDAVLATDAEGHVTRMNPVAETLTGWRQDEARGRPLSEVFHILNEETRRPAPSPVQAVLENGVLEGLANHTVLVSRGGSEYPIADSAAPIRDGEGTLHGVVLVFRSIDRERAAEAALAASEARYRHFTEFAPVGVFVQCQGRFVYANPKTVELLGAPSPDHLVGRLVLDFIDPTDRAVVAARIRLLNKEGKAVPALEECWRRFDGSTFYGEATAVPHLYDGCRGALVMLQDVTARRAAADELQQARRDAEQANRAKSAFLAAMSHELRTPMNGVIGMVEVLGQGRLSPHQRDLVNTIRDAAGNLLNIVDDILDFSKIEAGRLDLEPEPVDLGEVLEGVCNSLVSVAIARGVEMDLFVCPRLPARVSADPMRLRQLLYNLVGNAIKFSADQEGHGGRVRMRMEAVAADPLKVRFMVADNGVGLAPEALEHLFTPFIQGETSTTRRFGGTGLGLSICKHLVDMMGGEIHATGAPGEGATFTVQLPFEVVDAEPPAPAVDLTGILCILVIHPRLEEGDMRAYLEHAGARVEMVAGAEEAAARAPEGGAVVVIRHGKRQQSTAQPAFPGDGGAGQLLITQGRRRRARVEAGDVVTLDGNAVRRQALVRAVAVAAGRISPEVFQGHGDPEPAEESVIPPPTVADARAQGRLILVAEDDELNQRVIRQQLRLLGYAAEMAGHGAEALRMWREGRYGLVLTDLHMPEMDGYELVRAIRREEEGRQRVPILALTANAIRGEANQARSAGMDEYLIKPLSLAALRAALEAWLPAPADAAPPSGAVTAVEAGDGTPPVVDITVLKALVGDDGAAVRDFMKGFLKSSRAAARDLEGGLAAQDAARVAAVAHRFKSAAHAVGAQALGAACARVEQATREDGATVDALAGPVADLQAARAEAEGAMEDLLAGDSEEPTS